MTTSHRDQAQRCVSRLGFVLCAVLMAAGCDGGAMPEAGFTECGSVRCQPGQYCESPQFGNCVEGCLSQINCLDEQFCDTEAFFPHCLSRELPRESDAGVSPNPDAGEPTDPAASCRVACEHFQTCGLPAAAAAQCRTDCDSLTADQRAAVATCGSAICSSVTTCLGVACLGDGDCALGQTCFDYECL